MADDAVTMEKVVSLCKRRGVIFPASEIYGGIANTYDYGHYGVLLKRNVVDAWWQAMIGDRDDLDEEHDVRCPRSRACCPARARSATSPRRASSISCSRPRSAR